MFVSAHPDVLKRFEAAQPSLQAFIASMGQDAGARGDILQSMALTLWEWCDRYDAGRSCGAWALGVAAPKIIQERRRTARFPVNGPTPATKRRTSSAATLSRSDSMEQPSGQGGNPGSEPRTSARLPASKPIATIQTIPSGPSKVDAWHVPAPPGTAAVACGPTPPHHSATKLRA